MPDFRTGACRRHRDRLRSCELPALELAPRWQIVGVSAEITLRFTHRQSFIRSGDVVNAVIGENVIGNAAVSKKNLKAIQTIFNE